MGREIWYVSCKPKKYILTACKLACHFLSSCPFWGYHVLNGTKDILCDYRHTIMRRAQFASQPCSAWCHCIQQ